MQDRANEYLEQMKKQYPTDYMSVIRAESRKKLNEKDEMTGQIKRITEELESNKAKRDLMLQKLDEATHAIDEVQMELYYLESKKEKALLSYSNMEKGLKSNLNEYIYSQKYETVKSILVKYKPKKKKTRAVTACIVFYFLEDIFEDKKKPGKSTDDPDITVPYLVSYAIK